MKDCNKNCGKVSTKSVNVAGIGSYHYCDDHAKKAVKNARCCGFSVVVSNA